MSNLRCGWSFSSKLRPETKTSLPQLQHRRQAISSPWYKWMFLTVSSQVMWLKTVPLLVPSTMLAFRICLLRPHGISWHEQTANAILMAFVRWDSSSLYIERDWFSSKALQCYCKALPDTTYAELERSFRQNKFNTHLIAREKEIFDTQTRVNLQGKLNCKYEVGYYFSAQPQRKRAKAGWPPNEEENLKRLQDAGLTSDRGVPKCSRCNGKLPIAFSKTDLAHGFMNVFLPP